MGLTNLRAELIAFLFYINDPEYGVVDDRNDKIARVMATDDKQRRGAVIAQLGLISLVDQYLKDRP